MSKINAISIKKLYVSRSVYQKLAEENKRLKRHIRTILVGDPLEAHLLKKHYKAKYRREEEVQETIRNIMKYHPDYKPEN